VGWSRDVLHYRECLAGGYGYRSETCQGKNRETSVCIYDRVQVLKYLYKE
jgi:hypothetical protein